MKKLLFLIIFFYAFLLSMNLFPAERVTHHLILGGKIHGHFTVRKDSPYVPIEGSGRGGGIGFYAEVLPFPYVAFESGFYIRSFNLGYDVGYTELQFPGIGKIRYPFSDRFAMSIGGGITYCIPLWGTVYSTVADQDPFDIPRDDLTRAMGFIVKMGFQFRPVPFENIYINIDLGAEHVGKVIKIKQTDVVLSFGVGYGLY